MQTRFLSVTQTLGAEMPANMGMLAMGLVKVAERGMLTDEDLLRTMPLLHEIARFVILGEGGTQQVEAAMRALEGTVETAGDAFPPIPAELEAHDAELEVIYPTAEGGGDLGPADREEVIAPEGDAFEPAGDETAAVPEGFPSALEAAGPPMPGWAPFVPAVEVPNPDATVPAEGE